MDKDILKRIQQDIDFILEHEDGLSHHDKIELNRLLKEKKKYEASLVNLELELEKFIDGTIK